MAENKRALTAVFKNNTRWRHIYDKRNKTVVGVYLNIQTISQKVHSRIISTFWMKSIKLISWKIDKDCDILKPFIFTGKTKKT